jgi:hypothetical protein
MRKRLVLTSVVLAAVAGGAWLWLTPGLPVKVGMTEKEVAEILSDAGLEMDEAVSANKRQVWANFAEKTWYAVEFQHGRVVTVEYFSYKKTPWAKFREWLGW